MIKYILLLLITLLITLSTYTAVASNDDSQTKSLFSKDNYDIHGFLGYKYIWSSIGISPVESYPEVGLLLNYHPYKNLSFYLQFNNKQTINTLDVENMLVYGYMTYDNSVMGIPFQIHVGKLHHEFGLYDANVLNPSTRPGGTVAPQSIYWNNLSATLNTGYGIHFETHIGDFKLGYTIDTHIVVNEKQESLLWTGKDNIKLDQYFGSHQIINVNYEPNYIPIIIKSSFTLLSLNKDMNDIQLLTFGIEYDNHKYSASAETLIIRPSDSKWTEFDKLRIGYSISLSYYISDYWEIYCNTNVYKSNAPDLNINNKKWKDFSIGVTKYFNHLEVKLDIHKAYGSRTVIPKGIKIDGIDSWWYIGTSIVYHF